MNIPLRKTMCATCPFNEGSKYSYLMPALIASAMSEASRICHSTGDDNAINKRIGLPEHLCRGARDIQLKVMAHAGVIAEPTDEAWNNARVLIGMEPIAVQDPK